MSIRINIINKINKDYSYNDFFFDVGDNIVLVYCQCADNFKETYMFEPNKDCFEVLNVNTRLILKKTIRLTSKNKKIIVNLAINYGSKDEIVNAAKIAKKKLSINLNIFIIYNIDLLRRSFIQKIS